MSITQDFLDKLPEMFGQPVHKFNVGDKVVYDGLVATIDSRSTYAISGKPCYSLTADADEEMSCTAGEDECEAYNGEDIDQSERLQQAKRESRLIAFKVDRLTDKYFRDGNH